MTTKPPTERVITIELPVSEAEKITYGLSDLLCWCRGWSAAATEEQRRNDPMGVDEARDMNIHLKRALREPF